MLRSTSADLTASSKALCTARSVVESIDPTTGRNNADRYYRTNEFSGYVQDKWQALTNLSITAGVRYDYHGGMTEKYGDMFNFDPTLVRRDRYLDDRIYCQQCRFRDRRKQQAESDERCFSINSGWTPMGHLAALGLRLVSQGIEQQACDQRRRRHLLRPRRTFHLSLAAGRQFDRRSFRRD